MVWAGDSCRELHESPETLAITARVENFNFRSYAHRQSLGGDLFKLIPIPLEPRDCEKDRVPRESERVSARVEAGALDILMQFARKVQEPGRSCNLSCLMLRRAKATEDR